jgi:hypothetical protein
MRWNLFSIWLQERLRGFDGRRDEIPPPPEGDFGGSYGFGHAAHKPDPEAQYVFENDPNRPLKEIESS